MVGSTVGSTVGGRYSYCTERWPVLSDLSPLLLRVLMRGIGAASCPMRVGTVPYRTVAVSRYCRTCYCTRTLVSHSFRDKD